MKKLKLTIKKPDFKYSYETKSVKNTTEVLKIKNKTTGPVALGHLPVTKSHWLNDYDENKKR